MDVLDRLGANTDSVSIRDRAIIGILYYDAFRRNEVAALDLKDVDLKNVRLWVTAKKRTSKTAVTIADGILPRAFCVSVGFDANSLNL